MGVWDLVAAVSSAAAAAFLLLRRHMLAGELRTWHSAPPLVQAMLSVLALYMGMVFVSIVAGVRAEPREALAYALLAAVSFVMLFNLNRNGRATP